MDNQKVILNRNPRARGGGIVVGDRSGGFNEYLVRSDSVQRALGGQLQLAPPTQTSQFVPRRPTQPIQPRPLTPPQTPPQLPQATQPLFLQLRGGTAVPEPEPEPEPRPETPEFDDTQSYDSDIDYGVVAPDPTRNYDKLISFRSQDDADRESQGKRRLETGSDKYRLRDFRFLLDQRLRMPVEFFTAIQERKVPLRVSGERSLPPVTHRIFDA